MGSEMCIRDSVYEHQANWAQLPEGTSFQRSSAVAVDSNDRVYVFQRIGPPNQVFDRDGKFLAAWPRQEGRFEDAHHIYIGPDDGVYLADRDAHQILMCNTEGELLMSLGTRYKVAMEPRSTIRPIQRLLLRERFMSRTDMVISASTGSPPMGNP